MKLYWVSTKNNPEDWFMVANSKNEAAETHEYFEGFGKGQATAKLVCPIPEKIAKKHKLIEADWPTPELLRDLGGKFSTDGNPAKVNFDGKIYVEGKVTEPILLNKIGKKEGVYIIKIQNTLKYKIGRTINLKQRLKHFETGNPDNIKVLYFIATKESRSLERHLHEIFKEHRISGEWYEFNKEMLEVLEQNLYVLQTQGAAFFKIYNLKDVAIQARVYE